MQLSCWISQPPDFLICTTWKLLIFKSLSAGLSYLQLKANSWILLPNSGLLCKPVLFGMWKDYGALKMRASITVIPYFSFLQITSIFFVLLVVEGRSIIALFPLDSKWATMANTRMKRLLIIRVPWSGCLAFEDETLETQSNVSTFQLYFGIIWEPLLQKTGNKGFA